MLEHFNFPTSVIQYGSTPYVGIAVNQLINCKIKSTPLIPDQSFESVPITKKPYWKWSFYYTILAFSTISNNSKGDC